MRPEPYLLSLVVLLWGSTIVWGQSEWTLDKCIDHALTNNLKLKNHEINIRLSEIQWTQTRFNYLPSVDASGSHGYNWGQRIDPFTNEFASDRVRSNNFNLNGNWVLFSGLQNYYLQKNAESQLAHDQYNLQVDQRNLKIDITAQFLQVLLDQELLDQTKEKIAYTNYQKKRVQALVEAKQLVGYSILEIDAQLALDSMELRKNESRLRYSKLLLKQFLNLNPDESMTISYESQQDLPDALNLGDLRVRELPDLKSLAEKEAMGRTNLKMAKNRVLPSLAVNVSVGSGYSGNNTELIGTEFVAKPFDQQLDENFYQSAMLTLNVPLFNRGRTAAEISTARIEVERNELQKKQLTTDLQNKIERLLMEIENARSDLHSAQVARKSIQESFDIATMKFEQGLINFLSFAEVRNRLFEADSELIRAKSVYQFKCKIFEFYFN